MSTRRKKYKPKLKTIYEEGARRSHSRRSPSRRTLKRSPPILPRGQRSDSIKDLARRIAREKKEAYEQLGCFGKFCKNIKRKLTRRAGARRRRATRKKRTRKRRKKRK